ncbi:MAG: DUF1232 domain-containing protein [Bacteroidaceae bacterium]|nr:DUF1232 domain-containing protein [Bacteroidaceae bacterium]
MKKDGIKSLGMYYLTHPTKLKALMQGAQKYASKDGLKEAKNEFFLICQYVKDVLTRRYTRYSVFKLISIVGALAYVLTPVDLMPDFIPMIGLIDDTAVLLWAVSKFGDELKKYKENMPGT